MIQIDIPMPEACDVCPFNRGFCYCYALDNDDWVKYRNDWEENVCERRTRPEYCPLKEQPEIIRCQDCKWWDRKGESPYGYCLACKHGYSSPHWEIGIYRTYKGDWYCAEAEKRKNDDEDDEEEDDEV